MSTSGHALRLPYAPGQGVGMLISLPNAAEMRRIEIVVALARRREKCALAQDWEGLIEVHCGYAALPYMVLTTKDVEKQIEEIKKAVNGRRKDGHKDRRDPKAGKKAERAGRRTPQAGKRRDLQLGAA